MKHSDGSQGFISIFLFIVSLLGAAGGALVGYCLDQFGTNLRLLAILTAFSAVALVIIVRHVFGKMFPSLVLAVHEAGFPIPFWISVCFSILLGGLAGHDLCEIFAAPSGVMIGLTSGVLAAVSMATLMILYFLDHPQRGLEF